MAVDKQEGNILFEKFELDADEMAIVRNLVGKYAEKIKRITDYEQIKLEMKVHPKGKNRHFEIKGHVALKKGNAVAEKQDVNPFVAIDGVMEKMTNEISHMINKSAKKV